MNILKTSAQLLSGSFIYIFVFAIGDLLIKPELVQKYIGLISILLIVVGFILSFLVNRFLFETCIIKSLIYSFFSFLLIFAVAFILRGVL